MANIIECPQCQTPYDASTYAAGTQFACTNCGAVVTVAQAASTPPTAAVAPTGPPPRAQAGGAGGIDLDATMIDDSRLRGRRSAPGNVGTRHATARREPVRGGAGSARPARGRAGGGTGPRRMRDTGDQTTMIIGVAAGLLAVVVLVIAVTTSGDRIDVVPEQDTDERERRVAETRDQEREQKEIRDTFLSDAVVRAFATRFVEAIRDGDTARVREMIDLQKFAERNVGLAANEDVRRAAGSWDEFVGMYYTAGAGTPWTERWRQYFARGIEPDPSRPDWYTPGARTGDGYAVFLVRLAPGARPWKAQIYLAFDREARAWRVVDFADKEYDPWIDGPSMPGPTSRPSGPPPSTAAATIDPLPNANPVGWGAELLAAVRKAYRRESSDLVEGRSPSAAVSAALINVMIEAFGNRDAELQRQAAIASGALIKLYGLQHRTDELAYRVFAPLIMRRPPDAQNEACVRAWLDNHRIGLEQGWDAVE